MSDFLTAASRFIAAKQKMRLLEVELQEAQTDLLALMTEDKSIVKAGKAHFVLTRVCPQRKTYLATIIKSRLTAAQWKMVQKIEVDRAKLEAAIEAGDFALDADCVEIKPSSPYIKVTDWSAPISRAS